MRNLIISLLVFTILTTFTWTVPVFIEKHGWFFFPIMASLVLGGLSGIIIIPLCVIRFIKRKPINKWLTGAFGLTLGVYIGWLLFQPIKKWDEEQKELSGIVISEQLKKYKVTNGNYPDSLSQLDLENLDEKLPMNYKVSKFHYHSVDSSFKLFYPGTFMSRWIWLDDKKKWTYQD